MASGTTDELAGFVERSREVKKMRQGKNQGNTTDGVMNLRPAQQHSVALLKVSPHACARSRRLGLHYIISIFHRVQSVLCTFKQYAHVDEALISS